MAYAMSRSRLKNCSRHSFDSLNRSSRFLSSSTARQDGNHYDVLGVSRHASRMDIKSKYFKLSKKYHPDMTDDPSAKAKFHQVREAYSVLGDDRQRRAYDRKLSDDTQKTTAYTPPNSSHLWTYEMHERRRRGATHAWEHPRRQSQSNSAPGYQHRPPGSSTYQSQTHGRHYDPHTSTSGRREAGFGTGSAKLDELERKRREHDSAMRESAFGRFIRVMGLVLLITSIGGGWSAHAS